LCKYRWQTVEPIRTEKSQQRKENTDIIGTSNTQTNIVITTEHIQPEPIPNIEDHKIKLRELRQLEQRLRKKEEQLKLKEVAINDTMTEKTRILDRMYKAEARNGTYSEELSKQNRDVREQKDSSGRRWEFPQYP
jgi:hypothetical protein